MNNSTQQPDQISIGTEFCQARQALALSLEEVSQQLSLRVSILQQIENDEFIHKSIPATFMKGYVRSYAKFLKLPESLVNEINFGEEHKNDLSKNLRSSASINQYSSHSKWVGRLSALVVLVICAMTGLWWWENYQKSNMERETLVQNYTESVTTKDGNASTESSADNATLVTEIETTKNNEIPATLNVDNSTLSPLENNENNEVAKDAPVVIPLAEPVLQEMVNPSDEVQNQQQITTNLPPTEALHIEVLGNCWISVKEHSGKILAQKEYLQGDILSFNQGESYDLIIGAPSMVKITYKGEAYPLKVDGRVAKFKLQ